MGLKELVVIGGLGALGYALVSWLWPSGTPKGDAGSAGPRPSSRPEPPPPPSTGRGEPWYVVLGVDPRAGVDAINQAWREQVSRYHPDKVAQMGPEIRAVAEEKTKQLNAAREEGLALRRIGM